jgi:hypothetical protein
MAISFTVFIFVYAQMVIPILYGIPYSTYLFSKGKLKFTGILFQFVAPISWSVGFFVSGFVLALINENIVYYFINDSAINLGGWIALFALLFNFLTRKGRADMKEDFYNSTFRIFCIDSIEQKVRKSIINIYLNNYLRLGENNLTGEWDENWLVKSFNETVTAFKEMARESNSQDLINKLMMSTLIISNSEIVQDLDNPSIYDAYAFCYYVLNNNIPTIEEQRRIRDDYNYEVQARNIIGLMA